jgi:hypothetical protein
LSAKLSAEHRRGDDDAHKRGSEVHQLGLHYRGGPLSEDRRTTPGDLVAGDRAPDAPYGAGHLFDLFRGPPWTALVFGDADLVAELNTVAGGVLHAHLATEVRAAYKMAPGTERGTPEHAGSLGSRGGAGV